MSQNYEVSTIAITNASEVFNNTTNQTTEEDNVGNIDNRIEIGRMIHVLGRPILIIFGTFGNLLAFYIMRRGSMRHVSTCFYMSVLALADTSFLWTGAFGGWMANLTRFKIHPYTWANCKIVMFFLPFSAHYSSSLLVMMSIEKFFALYFPLKTRSICTVKTAKWACLVAAIISAAFNVQSFFVWGKQTYNEARWCGYIVSKRYTKIYSEMDSVIYSFGPFAIMIISNLAIAYKFMLAKWLSRQGGTESTNQALSKAAVKGTAMLLTVSFAFILLTGPVALIFHVDDLYAPNPIVLAAAVLMRYTNHSINGVLYCISGSRFRREVANTLCCRKNKRPSRSISTISSYVASQGESIT